MKRMPCLTNKEIDVIYEMDFVSAYPIENGMSWRKVLETIISFPTNDDDFDPTDPACSALVA